MYDILGTFMYLAYFILFFRKVSSLNIYYIDFVIYYLIVKLSNVELNNFSVITFDLKNSLF